MTLLLIEHAEVLVTMDGERREIEDGALLLRENVDVQFSTIRYRPSLSRNPEIT